MNSNLVQKLWVNIVLQSIITSIFLSTIHNYFLLQSIIKSLWSTIIFYCLQKFYCFVFFVRLLVHIYFFYDPNYIFLEFLAHFKWSNPSSLCFSFNHSIPSLSPIVSMPFLSYIVLPIPTLFLWFISQKFLDFLYFYIKNIWIFHFIIFIETNS